MSFATVQFYVKIWTNSFVRNVNTGEKYKNRNRVRQRLTEERVKLKDAFSVAIFKKKTIVENLHNCKPIR